MSPAATELPAVIPIRARMTNDQLKAEYEDLRKFRDEVMVEGVDYGPLPGRRDSQPTLFKWGADKLCRKYGLLARPDILDKRIEYGDKEWFFSYTIQITLSYGDTGEVENKRIATYSQKINGPRTGQEKEAENRVLQMAAKRAYVAAVLEWTASSHLWGEDEEEDEAPRPHPTEPTPIRQTASATRPAQSVATAQPAPANRTTPTKVEPPQRPVKPATPPSNVIQHPAAKTATADANENPFEGEPEPAPATPSVKVFTCANCQQPIEDADTKKGPWAAEKLAEWTLKNKKRMLCYPCLLKESAPAGSAG